MSSHADIILDELSRLESAFLGKLSKVGRDDLISDYRDIITLRNAAMVIAKRPTRPARINATRDSGSDARESNNLPYPPGFVLSEAVRAAIREIGPDRRFRTSTIFSLLHNQFPELITIDRRGSIAATLSNLATSGEIIKETDGQRKVWYKAVNLRESIDTEPPMAQFFQDLKEIDEE